MADLAANIGANFSSYTGNSGLGDGAKFGVFNIDTKPLEDLGKYTMLYNKAAQEEKQKQQQLQAAKLAELTAYDLTTAIPKDREVILKEYNKLYDYVRSNPTVLDFTKNPKGYLEYGKMKNDLNNTLKYGKTRSISYLARQQDINNETNLAVKAIRQKELDKEISDSDIQTPIQITEQYDTIVPVIPKIGNKTFDVIVEGDNANADRKYNIKDMAGINNAVAQLELGILNNQLDVNSPEFKAKAPEEQALLINQDKIQRAKGKLVTVDMADQWNAVINQYKNEDGSINIEAIKAKNPIVAGGISTFEMFNRYVNDMREKIKSGAFSDKGKIVNFGYGGLRESDYQPINYLDGITPGEILKVQAFAQSPAEGYDTTIQETDDLQQANTLKETTRHNKAMENIDNAQLEQKKKEWQTQQDASETVSNNAWNFAKQKYGELEKLAVNGIITPDKIRMIPADVLKYLGTEQAAIPAKRDANGTIIESEVPAGFRPLSFGDQTLSPTLSDGKPNPDYQAWAIGLDNGKIKVLKVEKNLSNKDVNHLKGLFDNTKSTSIDNIATNRLKEELKAAGPKELNSFTGLDDNNKGGTKNTSGGTKSSSGSSGGAKGSVKMRLPDGRVGEIPADAVDQFLKDNPKAKKVQ